MADGEDRAEFVARLAAPGGRYFAPPRQYVQAFTIERPDGVSLLMRVLPGGSWRLREHDSRGDEVGP